MQHRGCLHDAEQPEHGEAEEPQAHDRPEEQADHAGAVLLDPEQQRQNDRRDRDDIGFQPRRHQLQPLDRAEHRDRRRDHAVAVEQRGREDPQRSHHRAPARALGQRGDEGEKGQTTPLAAVVGAHDERHVLGRDEQHHGPEHQRQHAQHVRLHDGDRVVARHRLLQRVQRAGPDVAEHDPDRADHEGLQLGVFLPLTLHGSPPSTVPRSVGWGHGRPATGRRIEAAQGAAHPRRTAAVFRHRPRWRPGGCEVPAGQKGAGAS